MIQQKITEVIRRLQAQLESPIVITQNDRCLLLLLLLLLLVLAGTVSGVFVNHCNTTQWNVAANLA